MAVPDINNIAISDASVSTVIGGTISFVQWFSLPPQSENNTFVAYPSSVRKPRTAEPLVWFHTTPPVAMTTCTYQACLSREEVTDTPSAQAGEYY